MNWQSSDPEACLIDVLHRGELPDPFEPEVSNNVVVARHIDSYILRIVWTKVLQSDGTGGIIL